MLGRETFGYVHLPLLPLHKRDDDDGHCRNLKNAPKHSICVTPKTAPKTAGKLDSFDVFFFCYCAEFSDLLDCLSSFEGKCLPLPCPRRVPSRVPVNEVDSVRINCVNFWIVECKSNQSELLWLNAVRVLPLKRGIFSAFMCRSHYGDWISFPSSSYCCALNFLIGLDLFQRLYR